MEYMSINVEILRSRPMNIYYFPKTIVDNLDNLNNLYKKEKNKKKTKTRTNRIIST